MAKLKKKIRNTLEIILWALGLIAVAILIYGIISSI